MLCGALELENLRRSIERRDRKPRQPPEWQLDKGTCDP